MAPCLASDHRARAEVEDRSRGRLVQLGGGITGMIHGPRGWQLELLKGAEKHQMGLVVIGASYPGVVFGQPPISRRGRGRPADSKPGRRCE